jgi:hypothetical protein
MSLVLTREGASAVLDEALNQSGWQLELCLYENDVTPGELDTGDSNLPFTEATGAGYASITLENSAGAWALTEGNVGNNSYAQHQEETFTFTGGSGTIYGYFIIDEQTSPPTLVVAERLPIPKPYTTGTEIKITPRIELSTRFE